MCSRVFQIPCVMMIYVANIPGIHVLRSFCVAFVIV